MQASEEEIQAKCRSDEPNFKHKKYLRSKFEEAMLIEGNNKLQKVKPSAPASLGNNTLQKVKPSAPASLGNNTLQKVKPSAPASLGNNTLQKVKPSAPASLGNNTLQKVKSSTPASLGNNTLQKVKPSAPATLGNSTLQKVKSSAPASLGNNTLQKVKPSAPASLGNNTLEKVKTSGLGSLENNTLQKVKVTAPASLENNTLEKVKFAPVATQPPLPPDTPPPMITDLKQEIEDDDYKCAPVTLPVPFQVKDLKPEVQEIETSISEEKPTVTMCRNFARGTCKKGPACIFAHELILSQLPGVYTFCRNFQNSVCSFPKCKFVHATVFEKEHFYRTGYLPPQSTAHLKEPTAQQPPPPPPQTEEAPAEQPPPVYCSAPAPPAPMSCIPAVGVGYTTEAVMGQTEQEMFSMQPEATTTPQNQEWCEMEEVGNPAHELEAGEPLSKKCKNCLTGELSEQLLDAQLEQLRHRHQERMQKMALVEKKNKLYCNVVALVLKNNNASQAADMQLAADRELNNLSPNNDLMRSLLTKVLMNMDSPDNNQM